MNISAISAKSACLPIAAVVEAAGLDKVLGLTPQSRLLAQSALIPWVGPVPGCPSVRHHVPPLGWQPLITCAGPLPMSV